MDIMPRSQQISFFLVCNSVLQASNRNNIDAVLSSIGEFVPVRIDSVSLHSKVAKSVSNIHKTTLFCVIMRIYLAVRRHSQVGFVN